MKTYRLGELVYLPVAKNASTYYSDVFGKSGWTEDDSANINFDQDHVFSHIQHPDIRHIKGTIEALHQNHLFYLLDSPGFAKLLAVAVLDLHSYPLVTSLGEDWCYKIDWIPLDLSGPTANELTSRLLNSHGICIDFDKFTVYNQADESTRKARDKLLTLVMTVPFCQTLCAWHDRDIVLYNNVISNIKTNLNTWSEISWLSNYYE